VSVSVTMSVSVCFFLCVGALKGASQRLADGTSVCTAGGAGQAG
jgi:hypothetical protein